MEYNKDTAYGSGNRNVSAEISISADKMKAYITIKPSDDGQMLTRQELTDLLNQEGIVYGINFDLIDTISKVPVYNEMICIAEGTPAVDGKNGKVEYYFELNKDHKPTIMEDGRVDYRELNLVQNVHAGQTLCSLIPPLKGVNGKNVFGDEIKASEGKPAILPKGRNVEVTEDGQMLVAVIDGKVDFVDDKINVFATYEIHSDIDNSTGNVCFVGNVIVRGNVLSGFTLEAGGNIEVWGVVEGAVLKAGGNIILRRGMQGLGKGVLQSSGDIVARYIEHSNIEAKNNITAEAIMHSNIKCGGRLELTGKKGLLVGGNCKVGKEISAKVIGSHMATITEIEVGVDPSLKERYKILKEEINIMESDIKKADQAIVILKKLEASGALSPERQEMLVKSVRTKVFYSNKVKESRDEIQSIEAILQQDINGKIRVYNFIYPGTKVSIGSCIMYVKETLQYCTLYRDGADIRVGAIDKG